MMPTTEAMLARRLLASAWEVSDAQVGDIAAVQVADQEFCENATLWRLLLAGFVASYDEFGIVEAGPSGGELRRHRGPEAAVAALMPDFAASEDGEADAVAFFVSLGWAVNVVPGPDGEVVITRDGDGLIVPDGHGGWLVKRFPSALTAYKLLREADL